MTGAAARSPGTESSCDVKVVEVLLAKISRSRPFPGPVHRDLVPCCHDLDLDRDLPGLYCHGVDCPLEGNGEVRSLGEEDSQDIPEEAAFDYLTFKNFEIRIQF